MRPNALRDFGPIEIGIALVIAVGLQAGSFFMLPRANPKPEVCHNSVDDDLDGKFDCDDDDCYCPKPPEEAVKVKPVLDLEGLTLKQGQKMPVLPDMWGAPKPAAPAPNDKAFASTKADKDKPPDDDKKPKDMADAGTEPPPDAGETKDDSDAGSPQTDPTDGGTENELDAGPGTSGDPNGVPDGDTEDPLKANAKKTYEARVRGFLRGLWNSHCTDESVAASGMVSISGRTVTGAAPGMDFLVGVTIPAPPENYPELHFPSQPFTFTCKK